MSVISFTYVDSQGAAYPVTATPGESLMAVATANAIPGIDGDCGGCCACGTCRVALTTDLFPRLEPQRQDELDVLAFVENERDHVRLGCQVEVSDVLQGAVICVAT